MRPVILQSDFTDYYDNYFDAPGSVSPLVFERMTSHGMNRSEILEFLTVNGFSVPKHGILKNVGTWAPHLRDSQQVVVYLDEKSHRGENKLLMTIADAFTKHPNCLAAEFVGVSNNVGHGLRLIQVGFRYFWIELLSDDWRASSGNVKAKIKSQGTGLKSKILSPLSAIDFVPVTAGGNTLHYAVDFSSAPIVGEYGINEILEAEEAAREIKQMVNMYHTRN